MPYAHTPLHPVRRGAGLAGTFSSCHACFSFVVVASLKTLAGDGFAFASSPGFHIPCVPQR